jgi:putative ABC transport system ATP-binding protein
MSRGDTSVVEVHDLHKVFGSGENRVEALRGVNLRVAAGEFVAVMGPSGSGKSTLLHVLAGMDTPSAGRVRVGGDDLGKLNDDQLSVLRRSRVSFVFQAFNLLDVLSAQENVALPLVIDGIAEAEANRRADAALALVGLTRRNSRAPRQLSGGEQQRVAIARALVTNPPLLLADEPTGNLDSDSADQIMAVLRDLVRQGQTILMVTHDRRHAAMAHRLLRLRDGRIIEEQVLCGVRPLEKVLEDLENQEALP